MTTPVLCTCDRLMNDRGICPHCDAPPPEVGRRTTNGVTVITYSCPKNCPDCYMASSCCVVCKRACGTPGAARGHESTCRRAESRKERR